MALAVVCCEGANTLALVELETGRTRGTIPVGNHPVHVTVAAGRVCVATMGERSVDIVDLDGRLRRVRTGVLGPSHIESVEETLFVPCTAGDVVAVIDPIEAVLEDRISVGTEPHEITISHGYVYVGSRVDGTVDVIDVRSRSVIRSIDIGDGARVQGLAINPERGRGYAIDQRGGRVVSFDPIGTDPEAGTATQAAPVGANPYEVALRPDRLFVPGRDVGTVHAFDLDLMLEQVYREFEVPVDVIHVDGGEWVVDRASATLRSLDGRMIETPAPAIAGTVVDGRILLSHYRDDRLSLVDPDDGVRWSVATPAHPFGIAIV